MAKIEDGASGALMGWTSHDLGEKLVLQLQIRDSESGDNAPPASAYLMLTKSQAAVLGTYLFKVSGQTPPRKKRGLLEQLIG